MDQASILFMHHRHSEQHWRVAWQFPANYGTLGVAACLLAARL